MIKKITNLKISHTEKTRRMQLSELISLKNKLISDTDWTQLNDCGLRHSSILEFKKWRGVVNKLETNNILHKKKINESLLELEKNKPIPDFKYSGDNLNKIKKDLKENVLEIIDKEVADIYLPYGYVEFIILKIEESLNYKTKKYPLNDTFRYKFILQESNAANMVIDQIVDKYLEIYIKINNKKLLLDEKIIKYFMKIDMCSNIEECDRIRSEIEDNYGY